MQPPEKWNKKSHLLIMYYLNVLRYSLGIHISSSIGSWGGLAGAGALAFLLIVLVLVRRVMLQRC